MNDAPRPTGRRSDPALAAHPPTPEVEPRLHVRQTGPHLLDQSLHLPPEVQAALALQRGPGNDATGKLLQLLPPTAIPGLLLGMPLPHLDPEEDRLAPFVTAEFTYVKSILAAEFKTAEAY